MMAQIETKEEQLRNAQEFMERCGKLIRTREDALAFLTITGLLEVLGQAWQDQEMMAEFEKFLGGSDGQVG